MGVVSICVALQEDDKVVDLLVKLYDNGAFTPFLHALVRPNSLSVLQCIRSRELSFSLCSGMSRVCLQQPSQTISMSGPYLGNLHSSEFRLPLSCFAPDGDTVALARHA